MKKDDRIEHLENDLRMCVQEKDKQIAELVRRIAELEASLNLRDEALADYEIDWEMWRE